MVVYSHSESRRFSSNCLGEKKRLQYVFRGGMQMRRVLWKPSLKESWEDSVHLSLIFFFFFPLWSHKNRRIISCCLFYLCYLQKGVAELILFLACCKEYSRQVNSDVYSNNFCYFSQSSGAPFQKAYVLLSHRHK